MLPHRNTALHLLQAWFFPRLMLLLALGFVPYLLSLSSATMPAQAWPTPVTQPAATAPAKVDYYAMTAEVFFKQDIVRQRFVEKPDGTHIDHDLLDAAIFHATNIARAEQKLGPLQYGKPLTAIARQHSQEMIDLQYFDHESPVPEFHTPTERFNRAGLKPRGYAENIAMLPVLDAPAKFNIDTVDGVTKRTDPDTGEEILPYTYEAFAKKSVAIWMNSPHHRANILEPNMKFMAVGTAGGSFEKQDSILITQNFSTDIK